LFHLLHFANNSIVGLLLHISGGPTRPIKEHKNIDFVINKQRHPYELQKRRQNPLQPRFGFANHLVPIAPVFKIEALIWVSFWRALKFEPFGWRASSNSRHQFNNIEIKYKKPILNLCMIYMVHASNTMWRIKNQPSNSTSSSDNALRLLVLVPIFQDSKILSQSMNSTPNPFRLTLIKASSVSRLSLVLLSLLTQFCFEKPRSQTAVLVGITSMACHSDIIVGQLIMNSRSLPQKNPSFLHTSAFTNGT